MSLADDAQALVARTTTSQGLPIVLTDPAALTRVAAIVLAARNGNADPHQAGVTNNSIVTTTTAAKKSRRLDGT